MSKILRTLNKKHNKQKDERKEDKNMEKLNLSAPWVTFVNELNALFEFDADVTIDYDKEENHVRLYVEGVTKADALTELLPPEKKFGNVTLKISVIPANHAIDKVSLIEKAMDGNGVLREVIEAQRPGGSFKYLMFDHEVAQFYNDQLDDPVGNKTMLYADIAKDVFGELDGAFYCTEPKN